MKPLLHLYGVALSGCRALAPDTDLPITGSQDIAVLFGYH